MNYGCKSGLPHDLEVLHDFSDVQIEICNICGKKFRYKKDSQGRVDNKRYLKDHIRHFAQPYGATKKIFFMLHGDKPSINNKDNAKKESSQ